MAGLHCFFALCAVLAHALFATALVTLSDVDKLTAVTKHCNEQLRSVSVLPVHAVHIDAIAAVEEDLEDTVAGALTYLDSELLAMLNVPMGDAPVPTPDCPAVVRNYHEFMAATTIFLQAVDEKQQAHRWNTDSGVFDALVWLQSLWASRSSNEQTLSFIEQQLKLYRRTGCFDDMKAVLAHDIEVVEYMNDLIDAFP